MPDREKVIKGCENWVKNHKGEDLLIEYSSIVELLALLKEQDETISNLNETVKNLLQQIMEIKEYMTPIGKVKDVKAYDELLKEQDAVEPEIHLGSLSIRHNEPELTVYCGACKGEMVHKYSEFPIEHMKKQYKYCHHCGRQVKWE